MFHLKLKKKMTKSRLNLRNRVKTVAILAGISSSIMFTGCGKDGDSEESDNGEIGGNALKITATNVINSSPQIATVKVELWWETSNDNGSDVIVQAPYKNNGFTLELPATVQDKYLDLLAEGAPSSITISDKTVKYTSFEDIEAYDKDDGNIGGFYLTNVDDSAYVMWFYVDKNVTVKGEYKEIDEEYNEEYIGQFDMDLKKGWNAVYSKVAESRNNSTGRDVQTNTITTQKPSGVNFSWYFEDYYDSYAVSLRSAKPLSEKKTFFHSIHLIPGV